MTSTSTSTSTAASQPLTLNRRDVLRLGDAYGLSLASAGGTLWVTVDGEVRDIVLRPGESVRIASHADTVVSPLFGSALLAFRH